MNKSLRLYTSFVAARVKRLAQRPVLCTLFVLVGATFTGVAQQASAADTTKPPTLDVALSSMDFGDNGNLAYFADKVRRKEPVVLGYLGGSITQGSGASGFSKNYQRRSLSKLTDEIKKIYADAQVTAVNVGLGGTVSGYGAYRIGAHLLNPKLNPVPDLLVVEFAVNDHTPAKTDQTTVKQGMEGIVRQALRANPKMGIVFFYTTHREALNDYYRKDNSTPGGLANLKGYVPPSVVAHNKVARHYHLTEVLMGPIVAEDFNNKKYTDDTFFVGKIKDQTGKEKEDYVHPNDNGHALFGETLASKIIPALKLPAPTGAPTLREPLDKKSLEYARLDEVRPDEKGLNGWNTATKTWYGVPTLVTTQTEKSLSFVPKGTSIQLHYMGKIRLEWTMGGKTHKRELENGVIRSVDGVDVPVDKFPAKGAVPFRFFFPTFAMPDGVTVTVKALSYTDSVTKKDVLDSQLWGLFSIQAPVQTP